MKKYPVVIIAFKRHKTLKKVIEQVVDWYPPSIYAVIDRPSKNESHEDFNKVLREFRSIKKEIPVHLDIADNHLGLRRRVVSGLNVVFSIEQAAIILEDDCVPSKSFYRFCCLLLSKYKNNKKIVSIAGYSIAPESKVVLDSYYFSKYIESWGWATWKRAWSNYDDKMSKWRRVRSTNWGKKLNMSKVELQYWNYVFSSVYNNRIDSWAYRWLYTNFINRGLTIVPKVNLVDNIGFGAGATNTRIVKSNTRRGELVFPLVHPNNVDINYQADSITSRNMFVTPRNYTAIILKSIGSIFTSQK